MKSTRTKTLTAAVLAVPLLVGCGQNGQNAAETTTPQGSQSVSTPAQQTAHGSTAATDGATAVAQPSPADPATAANTAGAGSTPAASATATAPSLSAVADPCAGPCDKTAAIPVHHPVFGAMEIVSYERVVEPGSVPADKQASYAVYQNGQAVGYVPPREGTTVVSFGPAPVLGAQEWDLRTNSTVDKYGNVYLTDGQGVTVLTPTDKGYDSHDTMPAQRGTSNHPFNWADLVIHATGEPTVIQHVTNEQGNDSGKRVNWTWNGQEFVAQK